MVAVVGPSPIVARHWSTPLALCFIDGGHGVEPARADYAGWTPHVAPDGLLAIHDVFPDPADGGRPPYEEIYLPAAGQRPVRPSVGDAARSGSSAAPLTALAARAAGRRGGRDRVRCSSSGTWSRPSPRKRPLAAVVALIASAARMTAAPV